jgi:hypothetical protein
MTFGTKKLCREPHLSDEPVACHALARNSRGRALVWAEYSGNACSGLSHAQWQTIWWQDQIARTTTTMLIVKEGQYDRHREG